MLQTQAITLPLIPWQQLRLGVLIGNGSFGDVYQGSWQGQSVAIKLLNLKTLSPHLATDFRQEAELMWQCQSPNILSLHGICIEAGHCAMVMDYMPQGSLYQWLHSPEDIPISLRWQVALDIAEGLAHLHGGGILHRDLKSGNILLDQNNRAKISDFGLAKLKLESRSTSSSRVSSHSVGTIRWRAPELFKRKAESTAAADIYSYGMVLWELMTRELPFKDAQDEPTVISWVTTGEKEEIPSDCPEVWGSLIAACWGAPESRPTAAQIVETLKKAQPAKTKAWHFEGKLDAQPVKGYALLEALDSDMQKVMTCYEHHRVPGYDIAKVEVIYNPVMNRSFALRMHLLQERRGNDAFAPKWPEETHAVWRNALHQHWQALAAPYQDDSYPSVKIMPLWHGTKAAVLESIFKAGYANLAITDSGFFGKGLYSSHEAEYAYRVYSQGALILNWVASYEAYPVIQGDMPKLAEKGNYQNYDAHFIPVVPKDPANVNETSYYPTMPGQRHQYTEVVVFQQDQCLPRYLVTLQPTLPQQPGSTPIAIARAQAKAAASQAEEARKIADEAQGLVTEAQTKISKAKASVRTLEVSEVQAALAKTASMIKEVHSTVAQVKELSGSPESSLVPKAAEAERLAKDAFSKAKTCQSSAQLQAQQAHAKVEEARLHAEQAAKAEAAAKLQAAVSELKSSVEGLLKQAQTLEQAKDYAKASQSFSNALGKLGEMKQPEGIQALKELVDKTNRLKDEYELRRSQEARLKAQREAEEKAKIERLKADILSILKRAETFEGAKDYDSAKRCFVEALRQLAALKEPTVLSALESVLADARRLSSAYDGRRAAEARPIKPVVFIGPSKPEEVQAFLNHIVQGFQDKAEAMLRQNPTLVLAQGRVNDLMGRRFEGVAPEIAGLGNNGTRVFEGITALQYALWALDGHLWKMLAGYLQHYPGAAAEQIQVMPSSAWFSIHGEHAGPHIGRLMQALDTYIKNYDPWTGSQLQAHWKSQVGGAQLLLPMHVINEYCHPTRTFEPKSGTAPDFNLDTPLPRSRQFYSWLDSSNHEDVLNCPASHGSLGSSFGLVRRGGVRAMEGLTAAGCVGERADLRALTALLDTRLRQREELLTKLTQDIGGQRRRQAGMK